MTDSAAVPTILEQVQAALAAINLGDVKFPEFHKCRHYESLDLTPSDHLKRLFALRWQIEQRLERSMEALKGMRRSEVSEGVLKNMARDGNADVMLFQAVGALVNAELNRELGEVAITKPQEFLDMVVVEPGWKLGWINHPEGMVVHALVLDLFGGKRQRRH
ncbi:hypothetical protein K2X96_00735 [Patescibacteria group bacterium]|nr:hypothetical protein [Patescibacteria group bacterium]